MNYSEIYESMGFKSFDKYLENNFDIVIYDACNIEQSADGLILSVICDGVLFVVESGKIDQNLVLQSINNIKRLGANLIGIVLNKK
jgi:Mrp family chromosome partitioning ATPase